MRILLTALIFVLSTVQPAAAQDFFQSADRFLSAYVENGKVNYSALVENPNALEELVADISHTGLAGRSREFKIAFYINSYNILAIYNVVQHWPVSNPLKVPGFFDGITFNVASEQLTLDQIEHEKLRAQFNEERIHFALVCAAMGCPRITREVVNPSGLDIRLDELARQSLRQQHTFRLDDSENVVYLSRIFEWFMKDFAPTTTGLIKYLNQYTAKPIPMDYRVEFMEYDWTLNGF